MKVVLMSTQDAYEPGCMTGCRTANAISAAYEQTAELVLVTSTQGTIEVIAATLPRGWRGLKGHACGTVELSDSSQATAFAVLALRHGLATQGSVMNRLQSWFS